MKCGFLVLKIFSIRSFKQLSPTSWPVNNQIKLFLEGMPWNANPEVIAQLTVPQWSATTLIALPKLGLALNAAEFWEHRVMLVVMLGWDLHWLKQEFVPSQQPRINTAGSCSFTRNSTYFWQSIPKNFVSLLPEIPNGIVLIKCNLLSSCALNLAIRHP